MSRPGDETLSGRDDSQLPHRWLLRTPMPRAGTHRRPSNQLPSGGSVVCAKESAPHSPWAECITNASSTYLILGWHSIWAALAHNFRFARNSRQKKLRSFQHSWTCPSNYGRSTKSDTQHTQRFPSAGLLIAQTVVAQHVRSRWHATAPPHRVQTAMGPGTWLPVQARSGIRGSSMLG